MAKPKAYLGLMYVNVQDAGRPGPGCGVLVPRQVIEGCLSGILIGPFQGSRTLKVLNTDHQC